jgi:hypothetical protein
MNIEYNLNFNSLGQKRKYKLSKQKRFKIFDSNTWQENDLKNQWYFKDYNTFYIVISMYGKNKFRATCSGAIVGDYNTLEEAKVAALQFCDKILK